LRSGIKIALSHVSNLQSGVVKRDSFWPNVSAVEVSALRNRFRELDPSGLLIGLAPIRRPTRRKAWRAADSVSKECSTKVNAPQRCELYVLVAPSYSRNIGWSVINKNDLWPP
jgi:hypothetical protein